VMVDGLIVNFAAIESTDEPPSPPSPPPHPESSIAIDTVAVNPNLFIGSLSRLCEKCDETQIQCTGSHYPAEVQIFSI
jgi:hypothetical protein